MDDDQEVGFLSRLWRWLLEIPLVMLAFIAMVFWVLSLVILSVVFRAADAAGIDYNGEE